MTAAPDLLRDPVWFPIAFDLKADTLQVLKTSRQALSEAAFLDQRFYPETPQIQSIRLSDALNHKHSLNPVSWIFHTAFCCSTLMARALDIPGHSLALKEPDILMQLANARRMAGQNGTSAEQVQALEGLVVSLLGRRFAPSEAIVIKPTNSTNPLIELALQRNEPCLFMVAPLEVFLISIIKKGEAGRGFVRTLYNIFSLDPASLSQIPQRQAMTFTDLQVAALVWHHQVQHMTSCANRAGGQIRAMDGTELPGDPAPFLSAAAALFELGWSPEQAAAQAAGAVFSRNSKFDDQAYDAGARTSEIESVRTAHLEAIDTTLRWAKSLNLGGPHKMLPAASLL